MRFGLRFVRPRKIRKVEIAKATAQEVRAVVRPAILLEARLTSDFLSVPWIENRRIVGLTMVLHTLRSRRLRLKLFRLKVEKGLR